MFHASATLNFLYLSINAEFIAALKKTKGRTFVRPLLVTRFIRLHRGAQKGGATNLGSLFEPHHEQNLSANPKRTAKSFVSRNQTVHGLNMFKIKLKIYGVFTPHGNLCFQ